MFSMAVAIIIVLTGSVLYQAYDDFHYGNRRTSVRLLVLGIPLLALSFVALWLLFTNTSVVLHVPPNSFGPEWRCKSLGRGGNYCYKQN